MHVVIQRQELMTSQHSDASRDRNTDLMLVFVRSSSAEWKHRLCAHTQFVLSVEVEVMNSSESSSDGSRRLELLSRK